MRHVTLLLLSVTLLTACVEGSPEPEAARKCSELALGTASGRPFQRLDLATDWDFTANPSTELEFLVDDEVVVAFPIFDDGGYWVPVPLHPDGLGGGEFDVRLASGETVCPAQSLVVEALEAHDDDHVSTLVTTLDEYDRAAIGYYGADPERLRRGTTRADTGELVFDLLPEERPLAYVHFLAGGDESYLAREVAKMSAEEHAQLNTILAAVPDLLPSDELLDALAVAPDLDRGNRLSILDQMPITSAEELAEKMWLAEEACSRVRGSFGKMVAITSSLSPLVEKSFFLKSAMATFIISSTIASVLSAYICGTHPNEFLSVTPSPLHMKIEEDYDRGKMYDAINSVTAPTIPLNLAEQALAIAASGISVAGLVTNSGTPNLSFIEKFIESFGTNFLALLGTEMVKATTAEGPHIIGEDFRWEVDIAADGYVDIHALGNLVSDGGCDRACLRAHDLGDDVVAIAPRLDVFVAAFPTGPENRFPVSVVPIEIDTKGPEIRLARPGQIVTIHYEVRNAFDKTLGWSSSFSDDPFETTEPSGFVQYQLPANREAFPAIVHVESKSRTGLRRPEHKPWPREEIVVYELGLVAITEDAGCLEFGEEIQIDHSVIEVENAELELEWGPEALVDQNGVFTAPDREGEYEVTLRAAWNDGHAIETDVDVHTFLVRERCACKRSARAVGTVQWGSSGAFGITETSIEGKRSVVLNAGGGNLWISFEESQLYGAVDGPVRVLGEVVVTTDDNSANSATVPFTVHDTPFIDGEGEERGRFTTIQLSAATLRSHDDSITIVDAKIDSFTRGAVGEPGSYRLGVSCSTESAYPFHIFD